MIERRLVTLADRFWTEAGGRSAPPYDLHSIVARVLPATIVSLPELTLKRAESWLQRRGLSYRAPVGDRRLRGCLVAARGHGFIFVNECDSADEQRFTLAHEVAHFLLDHHAPRSAAIRRHGATITEVLNGVRAPTHGERLDAALIGNDFTFETHLLERHGDLGARATAAETDADRLAWELLAPAREVRGLLDQCHGDLVRNAVADRFGLPLDVTRRYLQTRSDATTPSFVEWLRPRREGESAHRS